MAKDRTVRGVQLSVYPARVGKLLTVQGGLMACPGYAQNESNTLVDAEAKLGELIAARPKNIIRGSQGGTSKPLPSGITKKESHHAQVIYKNPEIVKAVKIKAQANYLEKVVVLKVEPRRNPESIRRSI